MDYNIQEIAQRVMVLRTLIGFTPEEMAEATDESVEEYLRHESGEVDYLSVSSTTAPRSSAWTSLNCSRARIPT